MRKTNNTDLLFFTDRQQVYKAKASDFDDGKASVLGDYIPAKLGMDEGESAVYMAVTADYAGYMLFFFENGKAAKVDLSGYATKTNRKKLLGAYSDASPLAACFQIEGGEDFLLTSSSGRMLLASLMPFVPRTSSKSSLGSSSPVSDSTAVLSAASMTPPVAPKITAAPVPRIFLVLPSFFIYFH